MLQVYYLILKNSNLPEMKRSLSIHQHNLLLSPQRSPILEVVSFDGTNLDSSTKVNGRLNVTELAMDNYAIDIRERKFNRINQAAGIRT